MKKLLIAIAAATGLIAFSPSAALAQGDKPVRIIVPYPAGGQTDAMARMMADSMQKTLKRPVVVDNRPGAGGLIGLRAMQAAPADGDTLLFRDLALVIAPMLQKGASYNPNTDLLPIATVGRSELFLMVPKDSPAKTVPELIAYGKTLPEGLSAGNNGINTGAHIAAALVSKRMGVKVVHIPYKGTADATLALVTGDSKMQFNTISDALMGHIKNGSIRVLATASPFPSPFFPNAPMMKDVSSGAWPFEGWFSVFTAPGSPPDKVAALSRAIEQFTADPVTREKFAAFNVHTVYKPAPELTKDIVRYQAMYSELIKELGLEAQ